MSIETKTLTNLYLKNKLSSAQIAKKLKTSVGRVNYWLKKHHIRKRTISEALYDKANPYGDPFVFCWPKNHEDVLRLGLLIGLYWGEGNKKNKTAIRLGTTDRDMIKFFYRNLIKIYCTKKDKFRFGLQLFNDSDPKQSLLFWKKTLGVDHRQFQQPTISKVRGAGTYKTKSEHGVLTIHFNNKKLRNLIISQIESVKKM